MRLVGAVALHAAVAPDVEVPSLVAQPAVPGPHHFASVQETCRNQASLVETWNAFFVWRSESVMIFTQE